jgi:TonB-linked SusC/RagA family outer membrane protein
MLLGGMVLPTGAQAQTGTIAGTVVDAESGDTLPGANVSIVGTTQGASTDADGQYRITDVEPGTYSLQASFVGFQTREVADVTVEEGTTVEVNFRLRPGVTGEEVVVVAYGQQQRRDVTGSISSINSEDVEGTATSSLEQALQGQVAGVDVTESSGAPGSGINVQIRGINSTLGNNEPLYVVDGVPINTAGVSTGQLGPQTETTQQLTDTDPLATLSPSDIESIEVLKDASATSMYGSRGANGVVIITTKDGGESSGEISTSYKRSYSTPVRLLDMLDAGDYAQYVNEVALNSPGQEIVYGVDNPMEGDPRTPQSIADTAQTIDWQDRIFQVSSVDDLGIGFSGSDNQGSYAVRGNLLRQGGVIKGSEFLRGGVRLNVNQSVSEVVEVQSNLNVTRSTNNLVRTSSTNSGDTGGIVRAAQQYPPLRPFISEGEEFEDDRAVFEQNRFPDRFGATPTRYTDEVKLEQTITQGVGNVKTLVSLTDGVALDLSFGGNYQLKGYDTYYPSTVGEGEPYNGLASTSTSEFIQLTTEALIRFDRTVGDIHEISAIAGGSYEDNTSTWTRNEAQDFPDDEIGRGTLSAGSVQLATDDFVQDWRLVSGISRINYTLLDRYNFTATFRADGSSKFAVNNKWSYFPSLAFAWQAIQEPFLQDVEWLSNAKIRASWGQSGNQGIGPYASKAQLRLGSTTFNNEVVPSAGLQNLPNPGLKWETTTQYNVGVDLAFLQNRFRLTADAYRKETTDLLQNVSLAPNTGFFSALVNSGSVVNRGVELQVGVDVLQTDNVQWSVSANASRNRNEITSLPVEEQFAQRLGSGRLNFQPFIQREGDPIGAIYGYETEGLYRSTQEIENDPAAPPDAQVGDIRFADQQSEGEDGFGTINAEDRVIIGNANPDLTWGVTNTVRVDNFSLRFLIDSKIGGDIINAQRIRWLRLDAVGNIPEEIYENAFRPADYDNEYGAPNPDGEYPLPRTRGTFSRFSDLFVEDGTYVRLKNVRLGYTFDQVPYASSARVYVNGTNLWTITGYSGYSPEVSAFNEGARRGVDLGSYPQSRTFGAGIDLTF